MDAGEPAALLKPLPLLALASLCCLSSCEKVRSLLDQLEKKNPATTRSSPSVTEMPKGIHEMLPAASSRIVMVDYYADWCGPCRQLSPILENIAAEQPSLVQVCKVNVDKFAELAAQERVRGIPDVRIYVDGKLADQFVGALPEPQVRKRIEDLAQHLPPRPQADADAAKSKPKEATVRPMSKDWMPPGIHRR